MSLPRELARKALHVATAVVPIAYASGASRRALLVLLGALTAVALGVEVARARHAGARALFVDTTGTLLRAHEHGGWAGATWLLVAYLLAVLLFPRDVAIAAMLGVALGDAAGAVAGRAWGAWRGRQRARAAGTPRQPDAATVASPHHPPDAAGRTASPAGIGHAPKTWVGSLACALATLAGALLVARLDLATAALAGVLAALAERPRGPADDNLRIVLAVGGGILLWRMAFS